MPSRSRKPSKSIEQSSKSHSEYSQELSEDEVFSSLEEASLKYPSLIGKSALIGVVTDDVATESKGCKIWLSESSMLTSSIPPGSIVSVSLVSLRKKFSSNTPLSSFAHRSVRDIDLGFEDKMANKVGNYFALAMVFPSCKVLKNEVRLSSNLSYTMACPSSGRTVFVYPVHTQSLTRPVCGKDMLHNITTNIPLYNCKELFLEFVSSKGVSTMKINTSSCNDHPSKIGRVENGDISPPKTPSFSRSQVGSPSNGQLTPSRDTESLSNSSDQYGKSIDSFDVNEVFEDESAKKLLQTCTTSWLCSRILLSGNFVTIPILSKLCTFQVVGANTLSANGSTHNLTDEGNPDLFSQNSDQEDYRACALLVDRNTIVHFCSKQNSATEVEIRQKRGLPCLALEYEDSGAIEAAGFLKLGGLSKEHAVLKDIIISSIVECASSRCGLQPTKGVLLHGPPGTGKTSLAQLCVHDAGVKLFTVNGPAIVSQGLGESEKALHEVFDSASRAAPAVVFIDDLDSIAPARKDGGQELSSRMVATLLDLMDGIKRLEGVLVIAATNRPNSIEPALRRHGRLGREIELNVPSPEQRYDILRTLLEEKEHSLLDAQVHHLAKNTHGFVGADLDSLCNESILICLNRYISSVRVSNGEMEGSDYLGDKNHLDSIENSESAVKDYTNLRVTFEDFEKARLKVRPSAMREVSLEIPKVRWEDIGGQEEVKMQLKEMVEWPQKHPEDFKRVGISPPTGVLLCGPPGCSKTLLARAVASEAGLNFLAVKGPELYKKWVGESEKAVQSVFAKARANAPSVIFFDELDGLASIRGNDDDCSVANRVMSQLLVELNGLHERVNVTVIAATNRPDKIDKALTRPGRFDRIIEVKPPNEADREAIFRIHLRKNPCTSDVCTKELARLTQGCTGADIYAICHQAAMAALEENIDALNIDDLKLTMEHLKTGIKEVEPSDSEHYEELSKMFQRVVTTKDTSPTSSIGS